MILKNQALTSIGYGWKIKITRGHILAVNPIKLELMGPHTHWLGLQLSDNKVTQRSLKVTVACYAWVYEPHIWAQKSKLLFNLK